MGNSHPILQTEQKLNLEDYYNKSLYQSSNTGTYKGEKDASSVKTNKARRKGETVLQNKTLTTEEKQVKALKQRKKYDKSVQKDTDQNIRDIERGKQKTDNENRKITRIANRNNINYKDAEKVYWKRQSALGKFKKGERVDWKAQDLDNKERQENIETNKKEIYDPSKNYNDLGLNKILKDTSTSKVGSNLWKGGENEFIYPEK